MRILFGVLAAGLLLPGCGARWTTSAGSGPTGSGDFSITVFAAASLTKSFTEIASAYEVAHPGAKVTLNFGASSELVTQINNGAPADVFASADQKNCRFGIAA